MNSENVNENCTSEPVEGEFENSPLGEWLAARAAEGIRTATGA